MDLIEVKTDDGVTIRTNEGTADDLREVLDDIDEAAASRQSPATPRGEAAAAGASTGDTSVAAPVAEKPKPDRRTRDGKKASIQSEIDDLAARHGESQREYEATQAKLATARAELADLERKQKPVAQETPKPAASDDPEPTFEQFIAEPDAATAYYRALAKWEGRQETRKYLGEQTQKQNSQRALDELLADTRTKQATAKAKLDEAAKTDPAVWTKVAPFVDKLHPVSQMIAAGLSSEVTGVNAIADCVLDSEAPDRLLLHFVEHPDDFDRISNLPTHLAMREMGKLDHRVCAADRGPAARPILASAAPPPSKPLGGAPTVRRADPPGDDASDAEWEAFHGPQRKRFQHA